MGFRGSRVQIPPSRLRPPPRRGPCRYGGLCPRRPLRSRHSRSNPAVPTKSLQQLHLGGEHPLAPNLLRHFLRFICPRFSPCHLGRRRRFSVRGAGPHFASNCTICLASSPRQSCRETPSVFFADGRFASRYSQ